MVVVVVVEGVSWCGGCYCKRCELVWWLLLLEV